MTQNTVHLELQPDNAKRLRARTAMSAAQVAAGFMAAVAMILIVNFAREKHLNPLTVGPIEEKKAQLASQPENEELKEAIRKFDQSVRNKYFAIRSLASRGAWLMLAGSVALVVSLKLGAKFSAAQYIPDPNSTARSRQAHMAQLARQAIGGFGALTAGVLIALAAMSHGAMQDSGPAAEPRFTGNSGSAGASPSHASPSPVAPLPPQEQFVKNWPGFRGPFGIGVVVAAAEYPTDWNASGKNVLWKVPVPMPGNGSPIVWENQIFLAGGTAEKREVMCFDAITGKLLWEQQVGNNGLGGLEVMEDTGCAPGTPATDGRLVYAMFPTGDLAAIDLSGKKIWSKNLGLPKNAYGHASSLLTYQGKLIVQYDQGDAPKDANSFLYGFDGATGKELFKTKRDVHASWSSPILALAQPAPQIVTSGNPWVFGYDASSGTELWRAKLMNGEVAPSPVFADGMVYVCNDRAVLAAVKPDGKGDVTASHVPWKTEDNLPDIVSPLAANGLVWMVTSSGHITCQDGKTGATVWEKDLDVDVKSSPTLVGKNVYLLDCKGAMHIFEAGREFKEIGKPTLGPKVKDDKVPAPEFDASPAYAGGRIYIRSKLKDDNGRVTETLYCVTGKMQQTLTLPGRGQSPNPLPSPGVPGEGSESASKP